MKLFWREYNEYLQEFHLRMMGLYRNSDLSSVQIEQLADVLIDDLMKDLAAVRARHAHKGLPKYIFRKIIIS